MSQHEPQDATTGDETSSRPLLQAAVLALLLLLLTAGIESYRDLATARDREAALHEQIETTRGDIERLEDHIRRIDDDPATLEQLAREELGWVRERDVVIVLPEETTPGS
ncbi:MAG: septum formation initiator family protein [Acidobacteriota bacterium]